MSTPSRDAPNHPADVGRVHERLLEEARLSDSMVQTADGAAVHMIEKRTGPPAAFIHGSGNPRLFWLPLLAHLGGMRAIVVDRPGFGVSELVPVARTPLPSLVGHAETRPCSEPWPSNNGHGILQEVIRQGGTNPTPVQFSGRRFDQLEKESPTFRAL